MSSACFHPEIDPLAVCATAARPARSRPRIFLLSDVRLYREGLLWSLSRQEAFEVIGADDCSTRTLTYLVELNPEVVILDVAAVEAFATANTLSSRLPITKIIALRSAKSTTSSSPAPRPALPAMSPPMDPRRT